MFEIQGGTICRLQYAWLAMHIQRKSDKVGISRRASIEHRSYLEGNEDARYEQQRRNHTLSGFRQEESPDSTRHPAAEIAAGSNLGRAVTENNRALSVRVKTRGKSSRRDMATCRGYGSGGCKTKYTGSQGSPARCQGVGCEDKWQIQKQKPAYGPAFFKLYKKLDELFR